MNPALAAIAAVTIGGAILAVSARDARATVLGLLVVLLGAPLIADPWPDPLSILARIAATMLAIRLISIGLRGELTVSGTRIGWPAEALLAAAAAVVGFGSHGLGAAALGPAEAQAAGFALVVLAAAPLFNGRDAVRLAVGAVLLLMAASLIRVGLGPRPTEAEHLVGAVLTIALGGAVAVIVVAARAAGGLDAIDALAVEGRGRRLPDAHRPPERPVRGPRGRAPNDRAPRRSVGPPAATSPGSAAPHAAVPGPAVPGPAVPGPAVQSPAEPDPRRSPRRRAGSTGPGQPSRPTRRPPTPPVDPDAEPGREP